MYQVAEDRYESMRYRPVGRSGLVLPALSLGLWHNFGDDVAFQNQRDIVRRAFDLGVTHFDLANSYGPPPGSAETNFGRLLREDLGAYRDELIISTKAGWAMRPGPYGGPGGSRKYLLSSLDASLKRLGLDYVDIFYSHRPDASFSPLAQGLLTDKYLGGVPDDSRAGKSTPSFKNELLSEDNLERIRGLNDIAAARGQSLAQMALSWALRDDRVSSLVIGSSRVSQLEHNVAALDAEPLTVQKLTTIDEFAVDSGVDIWGDARRSTQA